MVRLSLLILLLISSLSLISGVSATVTYIPGAMIAMTGSNSDVRFDVASALYADSIVDMNPTLITVSKTFTGTFYAKNIGWIVFASGSNQVTLNCGSQVLNNLTANCTLTGTGWNENVGDIYFAGVVYNPTTGLLSGSAITFAGDISLTDIVLPLMPVVLEQVSPMVASGATKISVKDAWMYDAGSTPIWSISVIPLSGFFAPSTSHNDGSFSVDFSLATSYAIEITDTNGSVTTISPFVVTPDIIATSLNTASYYASDFCTGNPMDPSCPDGATRSPTKLLQEPPSGGSPVVADGSDKYEFTLKARDQYGNRVETGTMRIQYDTTVKNIQTDPLNGTDNIHYGPSDDGDAFISDKIPTGFFGTSETTLTLTPSDITYTIASTAPTDTNNEIKLNSIIYSSGGIDTNLALGNPSLLFTALFTASVISGTPIVNTPHTFETTVVTNRTTSITPTVISTLEIGSSIDQWRALSPRSDPNCTKEPMATSIDLCDWGSLADPVSVIATKTPSSDFVFTGTYITWSMSPASTNIQNYIYYKNGTTDVLYNTTALTVDPATPTTQRLRVLGQSGEGVGGGSNTRVDLINSIKRQVALLSRNRLPNDPYNDVDYVVYQGVHTVINGNFDTKRAIIVVGGDIIISENILNRVDHPLAIMALADATGNGGNIKIKGTVTDIHSSLIAEHAIISERSDSQLYIHGSLVSANPPREIAPTVCPYFAQAGCTRSDYDLPGSRDAYAALTDKAGKSSVGGVSYPSPLVIEGDPRMMRDPAPAMGR